MLLVSDVISFYVWHYPLGFCGLFFFFNGLAVGILIADLWRVVSVGQRYGAVVVCACNVTTRGLYRLFLRRLFMGSFFSLLIAAVCSLMLSSPSISGHLYSRVSISCLATLSYGSNDHVCLSEILIMFPGTIGILFQICRPCEAGYAYL